MWDKVKMNSIVEQLKSKDVELGIKKYQLKQCSYVATEYEKKLQELMGDEAFYEYMKDVMHQLLEKDLDFIDDEDEEFDEILEDLKCSL